MGIDQELSHRTFDDYYILEQTGNKTYRVTMVIDSEFLASEDTVYPVLIDPTANIISYTISDTTGLSTGGTTYWPYLSVCRGRLFILHILRNLFQDQLRFGK